VHAVIRVHVAIYGIIHPKPTIIFHLVCGATRAQQTVFAREPDKWQFTVIRARWQVIQRCHKVLRLVHRPALHVVLPSKKTEFDCLHRLALQTVFNA